MKKILLLALSIHLTLNSTNDLEFVVIIPSYNNGADNGKWIKRNLESISKQDIKGKLHVYHIDDCSTDNSRSIVDETVSKLNLSSKITVIKNKTRLGALANITNTIYKYVKNHQIIVLLDGDDALRPQALQRLELEYSNPEVWATYGSFVYYPGAERGFSQALPQEIWDNRSFRKNDFVFQHLRTFRAALFKKIKLEHLKDASGKFFPMAWDLAIMIPLAELCTPYNKPSHMHYISDILYIYNCDNPLSDFRTNRPLQMQIDNYIRSLPVYEPLFKLDLK